MIRLAHSVEPIPRSVESLLREGLTMTPEQLARRVVITKSLETQHSANKRFTDLRLAFTGMGYARFGMDFSRALMAAEKGTPIRQQP